MREEGHYTIKRVQSLPKRGNSNLLYALRETQLDKLYRWNSNNNYETINLGPNLSSISNTFDNGIGINPTSESVELGQSPLNSNTVIDASGNVLTLQNTDSSVEITPNRVSNISDSVNGFGDRTVLSSITDELGFRVVKEEFSSEGDSEESTILEIPSTGPERLLIGTGNTVIANAVPQVAITRDYLESVAPTVTNGLVPVIGTNSGVPTTTFELGGALTKNTIINIPTTANLTFLGAFSGGPQTEFFISDNSVDVIAEQISLGDGTVNGEIFMSNSQINVLANTLTVDATDNIDLNAASGNIRLNASVVGETDNVNLFITNNTNGNRAYRYFTQGGAPVAVTGDNDVPTKIYVDDAIAAAFAARGL